MLLSIKTMYRNVRMGLRKIQYEKRYRQQKSSLLQELAEKNERYSLFITNDNLGGTKQFENNYVNGHQHIVVLRRHSYGERPDLIYEIIDCDSGNMCLLHLEELVLLESVAFDKIIVNTMVHFSETLFFLQKIVEYKKKNQLCKLIYMVHDFNSICVNCNLFVHNHFCKIDCEQEQCALKLGNSVIKIHEWRAAWQEFLSQCDEVRCFSHSSKMLILQAYPELEHSTIKVIPHDTSFIEFHKISGLDKLSFHLGIVGNCGADFKGKSVVEKIIKQYGDKIPITLIGSEYRQFRLRRKFVRYMGSYQHNELQNILEENKISCVLFPSIWPETFSYIVSELMAMDIPIICFDYGAQAEKVKKYEKGEVCKDVAELMLNIDRRVEKY